jgi:hypothetical protein
VAGSNVSIPFGWQLVIDESPPPLKLLLFEGAVSFSNSSSITLTATYIVVQHTGVLSAGQPDKPHPTAATILLSGNRNTPQLAITSNLVLGSKVCHKQRCLAFQLTVGRHAAVLHTHATAVETCLLLTNNLCNNGECLQVLAAVSGGRLTLHGLPVPRRWTRLAGPVAAGDSVVTVAGGAPELTGWVSGREVLITSSTFNPEQAERRRILAVDSAAQPGQLQLTLDAALSYYHGGAENR